MKNKYKIFTKLLFLVLVCCFTYIGISASKVLKTSGNSDNNVACTENGCDGMYENGICSNNKTHYQAAPINNNVYEISNAGQLYWFTASVNSKKISKKSNAILMDDIVLNKAVIVDGKLSENRSDFLQWTPIANYSSDNVINYHGTFDGKGHTIKGLYLEKDSRYAGFVGVLGPSGVLKNLTIVDSYIMCENKNTGMFTGMQYGNIENCTVKNSIVKGNENLVGGISGHVKSSNDDIINITNCTVESCEIIGKKFVGGIAGHVATNANIIQCASINCEISSTGIYDDSNSESVIDEGGRVGGIAGLFTEGSIIDCYSISNLSGTRRVSGIAGYLQKNATIKNCYFSGDINSEKEKAEITIINVYDDAAATDPVVENCYYTGNNVGVMNYEGFDKITNVNSKTNEKFASGEVAYLLNGKKEDWKWKQTLEKDNFPSFTGEPIYAKFEGNCDPNSAVDYFNEPQNNPHEYENGICKYVEGETHYQHAVLKNDVYEISNAGQFYWFANKVNEGKTENYGKLMDNIDITSLDITIGDSLEHPYAGIFNGNGKSIKISLQTSEEYIALFRYVNGAVIKNLELTGTIETSRKFAASIIGRVEAGDVTIENCLSSVKIISSVNGDGTHGGLVGVAGGGSLNINNCGFIGTIDGADTVQCGGLVGWTSVSVNITNSYVAASFNIKDNLGHTFVRNAANYATIYNCYYLNALSDTGDRGVVQKNIEAFTSGEVTYLLNNCKDNGTWKQTLGENGDLYPNFNGNPVYAKLETCSPNTIMGYFNEEQVKPTHNYKNGICTNVAGETHYEEALLNGGIYEISNAGQLYWFANKVNEGLMSIKGKLTSDIDLENNSWLAIGTTSNPYKGSFDGDGKIISGLSITATINNQGLFGVTSGATIKDFTVKGIIVISATEDNAISNVGGAVAYAKDSTIIENVISYVNINDTNMTANSETQNIAGVVGNIEQSTIKNCSYYETLMMQIGKRSAGIVGMSTNSTITYCNNYGTITFEGISNHIGGVVGSSYSTTKLSYCINYGDVLSGGTDCIGGVVAYGHVSGEIKYCANIGKITCTASGNCYIGGILGYINQSSFKGVERCFNYGSIVTIEGYDNNAGAIVGGNLKSSPHLNNYYLNTSCAKAFGNNGNSSIAEAKTYEQFDSGEVAYLLGEPWGQDLSKDIYPIINGNSLTERFALYGQSVNIGGDLSVKYYVAAFSKDFDASKLSLEITFHGMDNAISGSIDTKTGLYVFVLEGINPQFMGDNIMAVLKYDGIIKDKKDTYSVEENLKNLLQKYEKNTSLVELINNTLAYGAATEKYRGYTSLEGNYTLNDVSVPESTIITSESFTNYDMIFGNMNYLTVEFILSEGEEIYVNGENYSDKKIKNENSYLIMIAVTPSNFNKTYSFTICDNEGTEKVKFEISVNDCLYNIKNKENASQEIKNLVSALYAYGESVRAYFE